MHPPDCHRCGGGGGGGGGGDGGGGGSDCGSDGGGLYLQCDGARGSTRDHFKNKNVNK